MLECVNFFFLNFEQLCFYSPAEITGTESFLHVSVYLCQCSGVTLSGHQLPTKSTLSFPSSAVRGRDNTMVRVMGQDKDREKSLTSYCNGKNRLGLEKTNLFCYQSNQSRVMKNNPKS